MSVTMKIKLAGSSPNESYEEKNIRLKRPLSPHVEIYAMKMQTMLSLSHRISGIFLTSYVVMFAVGSFFLDSKGYDVLSELYAYNIPPVVYTLAKVLLVLPLSYHYSSGIRHLVWDFTGNFLRLPAVNISGFIVMISTIIGVLLCMALSSSDKPRKMRCLNPSVKESVDDTPPKLETEIKTLSKRDLVKEKQDITENKNIVKDVSKLDSQDLEEFSQLTSQGKTEPEAEIRFYDNERKNKPQK